MNNHNNLCDFFACLGQFLWPRDNQAGSGRIKPNQTKSNRGGGRKGLGLGLGKREEGGGSPHGQTQSNRKGMFEPGFTPLKKAALGVCWVKGRFLKKTVATSEFV
jgi:hypothetical protein